MIDVLLDYTPSLSPWIENLPFNWEPLTQLGEKLTLKKHVYIFLQDQPSDYIYLVVSGRVRLFLTSPAGDEKAIAIIGKNGLIGECGIFENRIYSSSAITASKVTVMKIPAIQFQEIMKTSFAMTTQVLYLMNVKLRILTSHTMQLSFYSAVQRICYTLLQLAQTYGKTIGKRQLITVRFTHQELANLVGTSRVTVANTMKNLEKEEIIAKIDGNYSIEDVEALHHYISHGMAP